MSRFTLVAYDRRTKQSLFSVEMTLEEWADLLDECEFNGDDFSAVLIPDEVAAGLEFDVEYDWIAHRRSPTSEEQLPASHATLDQRFGGKYDADEVATLHASDGTVLDTPPNSCSKAKAVTVRRLTVH